MIEVRDLHIRLNRQEILKSLTMKIQDGAITAIIGKNGSGKTTLLRALAGHLEPTKGEILIDEVDVRNMKGKSRAGKIAYLPQQRPIPEMNVVTLVRHGRYPYLSFPRRLQHADIEATEAAMDVMGIRAIQNQRMSTLSGGERQKVYLAMMLAQDTKYLLLDEPTTFLDFNVQAEIFEICQMLSAKGKTIVLVLHDLEAALRIADELVVLDQGILAAQGSQQEILREGIFPKVFHLKCETVMLNSGEIRYFFNKNKNRKP